MTTNKIDFKKLLIDNPLTKISRNIDDIFMKSINENSNDFEKQLFIVNLYCYLKYTENDFIIDVDDIWEWLGFSQKVNFKKLLEKYFEKDKDYIINNFDKNIKQNGGMNKQIILLNYNCFKLLCLKADTKKADDIQKYFMKLENIFNKNLTNIDELLKENTFKNSKEKEIEIENTIINKFPLNTQCVYIGKISNTNENNETLIKFGNTNDLKSRVNCHKKTYDNFILIEAFKVDNKLEIENYIKSEPLFQNYFRQLIIDGKKKLEILKYDENLTIENIKIIIKSIINKYAYNIENFLKLVKENQNYKKHLYENKDINDYNLCENLKEELEKKNNEIILLNNKYKDIEEELKDITTQNIELKQIADIYFNKLQEENKKKDEEIYSLNKEISNLKEQQENNTKKIINLTNDRDKFEELYKNSIKEQEKQKEQIEELNKLVAEYVSDNKPEKAHTIEEDEDENTLKYKKFIEECCIVRKDVEEGSLELSGQFRIWVGEKPKRELFEGFTKYLKLNFIEKRLANKEKEQNVRGFEGIKLKQIEYKKVKENMNLYETFIFEKCRFNPTYKEITNDICEEGLKYIHKLGKEGNIDDKEHTKNIKKYLKECPYTLGGAIRNPKDGTTQEGYYGISLFDNIEKTTRKLGEVIGKKVEKVDSNTNEVIETYKSIVEAANKNNVNEARIRYCIKNNIKCDDNSYYRKKE